LRAEKHLDNSRLECKHPERRIHPESCLEEIRNCLTCCLSRALVFCDVPCDVSCDRSPLLGLLQLSRPHWLWRRVLRRAGFTLPQVLSAPFPSELRAAPALGRVSWIANAEGRRNLWIGETVNGKYAARQLTHYADDDGVDLGDVAWSADGQKIAYVRGGDFEATSRPGANPALLPEGIEQNIWLISLKPGAAADAIKIAAGRSPVFTRDGGALIYLSGGQIWTIKLTNKLESKLEVSKKLDKNYRQRAAEAVAAYAWGDQLAAALAGWRAIGLCQRARRSQLCWCVRFCGEDLNLSRPQHGQRRCAGVVSAERQVGISP
jgi:hypothetical protein